MILKRARNDFRRRGRASVDEHDDRLALGKIARRRVETVAILRVAAAGRDDLTRVEKSIGHPDRLAQKPAGLFLRSTTIPLTFSMPPSASISSFMPSSRFG